MEDESKPAAFSQVATAADEQANGIIQHRLLLDAPPKLPASRTRNSNMPPRQQDQHQHVSCEVVGETGDLEILPGPERRMQLRRSRRLANQHNDIKQAAIVLEQEFSAAATGNLLLPGCHFNRHQDDEDAQLLPGISNTDSSPGAAIPSFLPDNQSYLCPVWNANGALLKQRSSDEDYYEAIHYDVDSILSEALLPVASIFLPAAFETDDEVGHGINSVHRLTPLGPLYPSDDELHQLQNNRKVQSHKEWYARVRELVAFEKENGHMNVPQMYAPNKALGNWVNKQRGAREKLTVKQLDILESIGFVWGKRRGNLFWNEKVLELEAYKEEHGNCLVPTKYEENPSLGRFVSTQRSEYKKFRASHAPRTLLTEERVRRLNDIGFVWALPNGTAI